MRPLLIRIAINASVTATLLAITGFAFAEMSATILNANSKDWQATNKDSQIWTNELRYRLPLVMALGGVVFVVIGEMIRFAIVGRPVAAKAILPPEPDAEKLLEDLLKQVEAAEKATKPNAPPTS